MAAPTPDPAPVFTAIESRRSVKRFTERAVTEAEIERLLELAVLAPNHRMTEPWRFVVLGPEARRQCGDIKGRARTRWIDDPDAAEAARLKMIESLGSLPSIIAVVQRLDEDPGVREEDYATLWMAIQNILVAAVAMGLGTHAKTGAVLEEPELRALLVAGDDERIVALIHLGEPSVIPPAKPRRPAREVTHVLP